MIQVYISYSAIHPSDTLYVYDGPDTSYPLIGAYNNLTNPSSALLAVDATLNNTSGCLTVRFVSNGVNESAGFQGTVSCEKKCQEVIAELDMNLTSPSPDTNYIAICPGTEVDFSANASFPQNDLIYSQSEATTDFLWVFGDGTTATGENVSHTYNDIGGYTVSLFATDAEGCVSSNSIETRVVIAGNPYSNSNPPEPICANDTLVMDFDMLGIGGTIVEGTPFFQEISTTLGVSDTTFLPDGTGECYETSVVFNCFDPGQTLDNPEDFLNLAVNMEHSFLGDLEISIICPNNQTLTLKSFNDPFGGSGYGGGTFMGEPIDDDSNLDPGVGYNYSWTPINPTYGTMGEEGEGGMSTLVEGSYEPYGTFYDLVGCPLNGQWTIEICDNWSSDNGYIFSWEMTLNPHIAPDSWSYTVPIDEFAWTSGPYIIDQSDESITINPPTGGAYNYTYTINDRYGCTWDTTITVDVISAPIVDLGPDITFCEGINSHTFNAQNAGADFLWQDNTTSQTYNATVPGTYSVTVSNGQCSTTDVAEIFPHSGFIVSTTHTDVSCFGGNDGMIQAEATTDYPPYFYTWSDGQTGAIASSLTIGQYQVTIIDNNGCETTETVEITEPTEIIASYNITDVTCYGGSDGAIDIEPSGGVPPYSYYWNNAETSQDIGLLTEGNYIVQIRDSHNCLLEVLTTVAQADKIVTSLPEDHYYCSEIEEILSSSATGGTAPYTYLWNNGTTQETLSISPTEETTYNVTITDSKNCSVTDNITIYTYPELVLIANVLEDSVCPGETTLLSIDVSGGSGAPYYSYLDGNLTNFPTHVNPMDGNSLNIIVKDGCFNTKTQTLNVYNYQAPEVFFNSDKNEGCPPLNIQFNYGGTCENCNYLWTYTDESNTINTSIQQNPTNIFNSGLYDVSLIVTDEHGCQNHLIKHDNIFAYPKPEAKFEVNTEVTSIIAPHISFHNHSSNASAYYWSFGNGDVSNDINPYYHYNAIGDYESQLVAVSPLGCKDTSIRSIKITEEITFYAPSAFTPDNDGTNETFLVFGNGISGEDFTLSVYNRWGEIIFSSSDYQEGWNGKINNSGTFVKPGTYSWICTYKDIYGIMHEQSGIVNLIY
jgi:gliding motility-associated-like protein